MTSASMNNIPNEAVEAAAKGIFDVRDDPYDLDEWGDLDAIAREPYVCHARAALEAAAPHMLAAAWDEGFVVGWDCEGDVSDNPYREATRGDD